MINMSYSPFVGETAFVFSVFVNQKEEITEFLFAYTDFMVASSCGYKDIMIRKGRKIYSLGNSGRWLWKKIKFAYDNQELIWKRLNVYLIWVLIKSKT